MNKTVLLIRYKPHDKELGVRALKKNFIPNESPLKR